MRKLSMIAILFLLIDISILAQGKLVQLHPILGDTITQNEKKLFLLFSQIPDSIFSFGQLTIDDSNRFSLKSEMDNGDILRQELSSEEVEQYKRNVDKLLLYYATMDTSKSNNNNNNNLGLDLKLASLQVDAVNNDALKLSSEQTKMLVKEARRYADLKKDGVSKGLWGHDLDDFIKTSGSWSIPVVGVMLKSAVTKTDPFIDEVIYRKK